MHPELAELYYSSEFCALVTDKQITSDTTGCDAMFLQEKKLFTFHQLPQKGFHSLRKCMVSPALHKNFKQSLLETNLSLFMLLH